MDAEAGGGRETPPAGSLRRRLARLPGPLLDRRFLLELFVTGNVAFLTVDVFLAHAVNDFGHPAEWIPVAFSLLGTAALLAALAFRLTGRQGAWRWTGLVVGAVAVAVGVAGLVWHLESQFFARTTLRSLVYSAPFAAPLAYAGLGFLVLLDRMVDPRSREWGWWVLFFAFGGMAGNLALSLADHAQNGFFNVLEWVPVAVSAFGVSFLGTALLRPADRRLLAACFWILALQVVTGLGGFALHAAADLAGPATAMRDNFIHGAPIFAPLLFADIAVLGALGLWHLRAPEVSARPA